LHSAAGAEEPPALAYSLLVGLVSALGAVLVVLLTLTPLIQNDFWIQAKVGELIWSERSIPRTGLFHYTDARNFAFVAYEWGPSALFHLLYDRFGYEGAVVAKAALGLAIFALVFRLAYRINRHAVLAAFIAVLTLLTTNYRHFLRPELFGHICLLLELNAIFEYRRTGRFRWLLALIPISVVWNNTHGSYLLGLALLPLFAAGDFLDAVARSAFRRERFVWRSELRGAAPYLATLVMILCAFPLNPHGFDLLRHSLALSSAAYIRDLVPEWLPTFETTPPPWVHRMYLIHLAVLAVFLALGFRKLCGWVVLLTASFAFLSQDALRHIAVYALATSAVLAQLSCALLASPRSKRLMAAALAVVLALLVAVVHERGNVLGFRAGFGRAAPLSEGALAYIREHGFEGNAFCSYGLGDQLIFHFYPKLRVNVDSRVDIFGGEYMRDYMFTLTRWRRLKKHLARYDVRYLILTRRNYAAHVSKMRPALEAAHWRRVYGDEQTVIFERDSES
jgi:hypothetical protein